MKKDKTKTNLYPQLNTNMPTDIRNTLRHLFRIGGDADRQGNIVRYMQRHPTCIQNDVNKQVYRWKVHFVILTCYFYDI